MNSEAQAYSSSLGAADSIWFKLSPLIGAADPLVVIKRLCARGQGAATVDIGSERIVFLAEIAHLRRVMIDNVDNYAKYFDGLQPIFGKAMITIDGALWQKIRQPQQPYFHPHVYADYLPYFQDALRLRAEQWSRLAAQDEPIEMLEQTWGLAADMVCRALFDREVPFNPKAVFGAVKAYTDTTQHRAIRVKRVHGAATDGDATVAPAQAIDAWLTLPEVVISAKPWQGRAETLLTELLAVEADPSRPEWDHQQVLDELKQYLWAGTETTALTLGWAFYLLSQHPDVIERIRAEAADVIGDRVATVDDVERLTFTRSVVLETLRLYPPAWAFIRSAVADDDIDGIKIRAGDRVVVLPYLIHHDARYWPEPEQFQPERFAPGNVKGRAKYSFVPFGAGKRFCVGGQMAQMETVLALAHLTRRFRVEYLGPNPARIAPSVTLMPLGGLPFRLHALS
jgi:cytochrome P450